MSETIQARGVEEVESALEASRGRGDHDRSRPSRKGRSVRRTDELTQRAATILVSFGFKPLQLMHVLGLTRRTAYNVAKRARDELERMWQETQAQAERARKAEERVNAASLREPWQRADSSLKLKDIRRFRS